MSSYQAEHVSEPDPRRLRIHFVAFLTLTAGYLVWRTAVVNWHVWYGPVAWFAEVYGLTTLMLFVYTLRRSARTVPRPAVAVTRSVDILIPTVNEPPAVLEPTVIGALRVRGVRDVLVLDDGVRPEVREMAARLGARYVPRASGEGAKAGNLNHGLARTDAEFIVTLDADHVPLPEFIERTLGYFDDPTVGFVQSPQSFYNRESFTFRRRGGRDAGWHEQEMFYGTIEPTRNHSNSVIYTGTSAMLRRSAIDSVGGFAPDTPTEDIHTSLRMHTRGWRGLYLDAPLAFGLEVENLDEYFRSRRRWAAGSLRLLFRHPDSPLRVRGLTPAQRLNYLSAMLTHLQGPNRLLYLVAPVAALLCGVAPVEGPYAYYGLAFLALPMLSIWTVVRLSRGHFHLVHSEVFAIADTVPMVAALAGLLGAERKFGVSRKRTARRTGTGVKLAYRLYAAVTVLAFTLALVRLARGEYLPIAGWSAAFLGFTTVYVLTFLIGMERYERNTRPPSYARFSPAELYHHIVSVAGSPLPSDRAPTMV